MKKALIFILITFVSNVYAENWQNGDSLFDAISKRGDEINVKWIKSENVEALCNKKSVELGYKPFRYSINACSYYSNGHCTIITYHKTTQHILGHELRHCFQGEFHPQ